MRRVQRICTVYFSATGTTKKVVTGLAETLKKRMDLPVDSYDFTLPGAREQVLRFSETDLVILGVPVYAGRVPNVLVPYLQTKLDGGGARTVPVTVYGNRNFDDALIELFDLTVSAGFLPIAAGAFIGEHSFSTVLAQGRPDALDDEWIEKLSRVIEDRVKSTEPQGLEVPGQRPYRPYYKPRDRAGHPVDILKVKPKVGEGCTACGVCAAVCPMGSIDPDDVSHYIGICIKCGACIKKCPEKVRYYDDAGYLYHKEELELEFSRRTTPEIV
jgi:ferredoxin